MNLLILTQKVDENDDVLGFFHEWIKEFAKNTNKLTVVCLYEGKHNLPENVEVLSLGKEKGQNKFKYLINLYKYIWQYRNNYDSVFVHMNQIYILLCAIIWRVLNKKIALWYAHGATSLSLSTAEKLTHIIFTSTNSGFRLKSSKLNVVGQGIDTDIFNHKNQKNNLFQIITVGRISPVKKYETLIDALELAFEKKIDSRASIIGGTGLETQNQYFEKLKKSVQEKGLGNIVKFLGSIPNRKIVPFLQKSDLFVNMSHTGSLDKTVLEAMSCGLPILTCNEALKEVLPTNFQKLLMYPKNDSNTLAQKIEEIYNLANNERIEIGSNLRDIVVENHSLSRFVKKIISVYEKN
jgi:glycosyltransferase involved in cell wall biosynthesis